MARYEIKPLPKNTAIIPVNGRFYPVRLAWADQGILSVQSFTRAGLPVHYSKRSLAVGFLADWAGGRAPWATLAPFQSEASGNAARRA